MSTNQDDTTPKHTPIVTAKQAQAGASSQTPGVNAIPTPVDAALRQPLDVSTPLRICKQCGVAQSLKQYRLYYVANGYYKLCKTCESINNKYKYLQRKEADDSLSQEDQEVKMQIETLYELQRSKGLQPPRYGAKHSDVVNSIQGQLQALQNQIEIVTDNVNEIPAQLKTWLTQQLDNYTTDYLNDTIYEQLRETYRPQIGIDPVTFAPIFDDTYRSVLSQILERFEAYEDSQA